jgi:hypothetical protein
MKSNPDDNADDNITHQQIDLSTGTDDTSVTGSNQSNTSTAPSSSGQKLQVDFA